MSCGWQNNCQSRPCNHLQNVGATTYKNILQFYTKKACKKHYKLKELVTETARTNRINLLLIQIQPTVHNKAVFLKVILNNIIIQVLMIAIMTDYRSTNNHGTLFWVSCFSRHIFRTEQAPTHIILL